MNPSGLLSASFRIYYRLEIAVYEANKFQHYDVNNWYTILKIGWRWKRQNPIATVPTVVPGRIRISTPERVEFSVRDYALTPFGRDPGGGTLQSLNEPFGFYLFSLQPLLKASFQRGFGQTKIPAFAGHLSFAERGGFEPPVQLPIRQFSKLVVSATHPSLLFISTLYLLNKARQK